MLKKSGWFVLLFFLLFLSACARQEAPTPAQPTALPTPALSTQAPTVTPMPTTAPTEVPTVEPTEAPTEIPTETATEPTPPTEPTPEPTEIAATEEAPAGCVNKAAFYGDVTIPDDTAFKQNVPFTKTWKVRNEGDCVWEGYKISFAGGSSLDGPLSNPLPVIQPGEVKDISVEMKSPPQGGLFTGFWELEDAEGNRFGFNSSGKDLIWVQISVSWYAEGGGGPLVPVTDGCAPPVDESFEVAILELVNNARAQEGLPALALNNELVAAARAHSTDMACYGIRDHTGSDGSNWYQRIAAQGYTPGYAGENIYYGHPDYGADVTGTFTWWMGSTVHRNNILSSKATQIGIGHVYETSGDAWGFTTLNIARP
ncbi:MAG: hypothetical protein JW987_10670 [Anaerolineaceae bacterium]|nr:hypothetical protein [Anaerolineaceae bacterium]